MKFCAVLRNHPDDEPGGAELQSQIICSELSRRGDDAYYVASQSDEEGVVERDGVTVVRLDTDGGYRGAKKTLSTVAGVDPDVVYFRIIKDLPLAAAAAQLINTHVVFNVSHDAHCLPRFADWPGKQGSSLVHNGYRRAKLAFLRSLLDVPDTIFVQTRTQQRLLAKNRDFDATMTGNGQPIPDGEPQKRDPPVVLWLANIKTWKRPHVFADVAEACTDLECEFWMVGRPTDGDLADEIRARANGISDLHYLGGCSIEESNQYIRRASVFVNTSKQEGFPNTFLQSWSRKTPVVSLNVDPADRPGGAETGYYDLGDRSALVRTVRDLLARPERRRVVAERAYSYAHRHHTPANVVDNIERGLPDRLCDRR